MEIFTCDKHSWRSIHTSCPICLGQGIEPKSDKDRIAIPPAPSQPPSVENVEGFTPGPWKLLGGIIGNDLFCRIHAKDVTSDTPRDLQVFALNDSHPDKNHLKRRFADMKLIAQAPTMYAEIQALQKEVEGMRKDIIHLNGQCDLRDGLIQQLQQENAELKKALDFILTHQETGSFSKWYQSIRTVAWKARYPEEEDTWSDKS